MDNSTIEQQINPIYKRIVEIFDYAKEYQKININWDLNCALIKLDEEYGELSEATLIISGKKPHKSLSEDILGEIADNIIAIFDISSHLNESFNHRKEYKTISYYYSEANNEKEKGVSPFEYFHNNVLVSKNNVTKSVIDFKSNRSDLTCVENCSLVYIVDLIIYAYMMNYDESEIYFMIDKKLSKWKGLN